MSPYSTKERAGDDLNIRQNTWVFYLIVVGLGLFLGCGDSPKSVMTACGNGQETFTFFGLGRNSVFTGSLRDQLDERLGSSAIARADTIALSPLGGTLLEERFPILSRLNRELNQPFGERVEHDVVKLMYRHPDKKSVPFDSVETIFSGPSNCMMLMKIHTRDGSEGIVKTLTGKYGNPAEAVIKGIANGKTYTWEKNTDKLIVFSRPDRNNQQDFEIWFYFVEQIENLIAAERAQKEEKSSKVRQSGKQAF